MRGDPNVLVLDLIVDIPTRMKFDMGMDPDVVVDLVIVADLFVNVPIRTKIELGTKPSVVTVELVLVVDVIFDLMVRTCGIFNGIFHLK